MGRLNFILEAVASQSQARAGRFKTLHGEVKTPTFMPVGTQATVKNQSFSSLKNSGSQVLLANTYHLMLRPGVEVFKKLGGIHSFMNWKGSVLTDSGGYQIFSLPHSRSMSEVGAEFQSYVDGRRILLTPEVSIETQKAIGSDIMMVLDQCIASTSGYTEAKLAMELTHRWAERSLQARGDSAQALFGIIQGACFTDLRQQSALFLSQQPFDGLAIGGLAVGESKDEREDFTELSTRLMPHHLPRYLMGVGTPLDLLEAVHRGVDLFDCIIPTSVAQRGSAFTSQGRLQLRRGAYKFAEEALDRHCHCETCLTYSRAYLHHLVKTEEPLGWQLIGAHNIFFYHQLMREIRLSIINQAFYPFYQSKRKILDQADEEYPIQGPKRGSKSKKNSQILRKSNQKILGEYEVQTTPEGFAHIHHRSSGEIIHRSKNPWDEANHLYIEQSGLAKRLAEGEGSEDRPLILWDVGLGAGTNAMAAIQCYEKIETKEKRRPLHLYSFENNLDPLKLALQHHHHFSYLRHGGPVAILKNGKWQSKTGSLHWTLLLGDFQLMMNLAPVPDIIYYDPFSLKTNSSLWTFQCFKNIADHCQGQKGGSDQPTKLYTYSASTAVRAALLAAGFFVGKGVGVGIKPATTFAFLPPSLNSSFNQFSISQFSFSDSEEKNLLGRDWTERWRRSQAKFPSDITDICRDIREEFEKLVYQHQQFADLFTLKDHELWPPRNP